MASHNFTSDQIEEMLVVVANAVERCGEHHLPLFEMLEGELEQARQKGDVLARARRLAAQRRVAA